MINRTPVELLAPAKNLDYGKAAINHGADAVYIGAPKFGARLAASNTVQDIVELAKYAHLYKAKIYTAFNTLLFDHELDEAQKLIVKLYEAGIDGLIIQDMALLEMDLPPVKLIASTQTHNSTPEKVIFLENAGFKRVILARELNLKEIDTIRKQTSVELEAFVHGALCVSYSGQCYMSQAVCGRSGNRGECAQPCRSSYDLTDKDGNILIKNKHLLSLKDLNLSAHLKELLEAGITSFKIEGRLKDLSYVKNVTAYYRQKLDEILDGHYVKASSGKVQFSFTPDVSRTFNRGYTIHNLEGRTEKTGSFLTQKSLGKKISRVTTVGPNWFKLDGEELVNGDGICFFDSNQNLIGTAINKIDCAKYFPKDMMGIKPGLEIYRNHDHAFEKQLSNGSSIRKIDIDLCLDETENGFSLTLADEDGNSVTTSIETEKMPATKPEVAREQIIAQLSKLGNTPFYPQRVKIQTQTSFFLAASVINQLRRDTTQALEVLRITRYTGHKEAIQIFDSHFPFPEKKLSFRSNVANKLSEAFYRKHGVTQIEPAFEIQQPEDPVAMVTKYCIRYQLDACPKYQQPVEKLNKPLFLRDNNRTYELSFDCKNCVMEIKLMRI